MLLLLPLEFIATVDVHFVSKGLPDERELVGSVCSACTLVASELQQLDRGFQFVMLCRLTPLWPTVL